MATQSIPAASASGSVRVWDLPLRIFHWTMVVAIAVAFLSSEEEGPLSEWHMTSGWVAAVLIAFRIVWGFVGGEHSRWSDFIRPSLLREHLRELVRFRPQPALGHNPLGAVSVLLLLVLVAAVVWTGAVLGEAGEEVHELLAWVLLALIGLHVFAVVSMSLLTRENLVRAMISGRKPADPHPDAHDARRPPWFGLLLAPLALLAAIWLILSYDPRAFELRPIEEHGEAAGRMREAGEAHEDGRYEHEDEDD